ncbi:MAG: xanthine dehydrogenase accessory protein XdhC [Casimicrobiaceae bacterium]
MAEWIDVLRQRVARDGRAVLVTVAHTTGSAPRAAGTTMVVSAAEVGGTIGGGHLEFEAMRMARNAITASSGAGAWIVRFPLAARLGQCCGGVATIAFQVVQRDDLRWLDVASTCLRTHTPVALVSRIGNDAAPMLVSADNVTGSLGAVAEDSAAIASARHHLATGTATAMLLGAASPAGATMMLHLVQPPDFNVLVFGNGHVGRALVQVFGALDVAVRWIDGREHDFPTSVPANVDVVISDDPVAELDAAPRGAFILILTHSHDLDYALTRAALQRDDWRYIGLIGSRSKRSQFEKRLAARGSSPSALARIVCPIGVLPGSIIRSKEPGAIAVGVVAEILALRETAMTKPGPQAGSAPSVHTLHVAGTTPARTPRR